MPTALEDVLKVSKYNLRYIANLIIRISTFFKQIFLFLLYNWHYLSVNVNEHSHCYTSLKEEGGAKILAQVKFINVARQTKKVDSHILKC